MVGNGDQENPLCGNLPADVRGDDTTRGAGATWLP